jgi:hypothetical protein
MDHSDWGRFRNAEAAFQAVHMWSMAGQFNELSAEDAVLLGQRRSEVDPTFAGYHTAWCAMMAVLRAKFADETLHAWLRTSGDAFLLHHGSSIAGDSLWDNHSDGSGSNWLGLQLMLLRDEVQPSAGGSWTEWVRDVCKLDLEYGRHSSADPGPQEWQKAVRKASHSTMARLGTGASSSGAQAMTPATALVQASLQALKDDPDILAGDWLVTRGTDQYKIRVDALLEFTEDNTRPRLDPYSEAGVSYIWPNGTVQKVVSCSEDKSTVVWSTSDVSIPHVTWERQ